MDAGSFFCIVDGPSISRILDSFEYFTNERAYVDVWFKVVDQLGRNGLSPIPVEMSNVRITGISLVGEPGPNGADYSIHGSCVIKLASHKHECHDFEAFYNARKRQGTISFY